MPLRQTDRGKSDEPEGWGWEQQPATREENHHYRVSGLVQHEMGGRSVVLQDGDQPTRKV